MADTRYVQSRDGTFIAYQVVGDGPIDLVYVPTWVSQVEQLWEDPGVASFFNRLASFSRLIMFDRRGSGLSDPTPGTLEEQMDDVLAVMDAAGSERAGLFAQLEGGAMAALFAATHPARVGALALYATFPRASWAPDYDWALKPEERIDPGHAGRFEAWGTGAMADMFAPSMASDPRFRAWFAKLERLSASPGMILRINEMIAATDVRDVLPSIRVPTLVLHRPQDGCIDFRHSQYLADHIPGARLVKVPGTDTLPHIGEGSDLITDELEVFFTGARGHGEADRVLATVLFTDIVGSTQHAARMGDLRFRELLDRHHELVRRELDRYRGREVKTIGDGFLATFDGPARAIRAASEITDSVRALGIELRAGLHTGELEVIGNDVGGLAVHIGARVSELAAPGEVLVSSTVKDLVVGSGIEFDERGTTELRGVPGEWRLYAVAAPH